MIDEKEAREICDAILLRCKGNPAEVTLQFTDAALTRFANNIIHQNVAYLMRCGPPDALDLMVAANFGTLAADLLLAKQSGRMVALKNGCYTHVSMTETRAGARKVDIDALYDAVDYRPRMRAVEGMPMFLR